MVDVEVRKNIDASLDKVWALFSNFGDMSWLEAGQTVEAIGEGPGMIRRLSMPGIEPFDEILISMDHDKHEYSYRIPKNAVIPFDDYVAVVTISGNEQSAEVVWASTFGEAGLDPADARKMIEDNYLMMLNMAAEKLTA